MALPEVSSLIGRQDKAEHGESGSLQDALARERLTPAEQETVEQNLALVHHIVARLTERFPASRNRDDLIQVGALGLIEATRRFDPARAVSFSTYAGRRIEGAVLDALRSDDWASRSVRTGERRLLAAGDQLYAKLGRRPTDRELSRSMQVDVQKLHALRADLAQARVESLNRGMDSTGERSSSTQIDVPSPQADGEQLEHREMIGYLRDAVRLLPERHRLIIIGHFIEGKTMTEIGEFIGVTQSRASQLKGEALTMMRDGLAAALGEREVADTPPGKQRRYNEALESESSWRQRLAPTEL